MRGEGRRSRTRRGAMWWIGWRFMSFGLCEGRGVLVGSPQWDSWVLPNALIRSQNPTKDASITVARNIGASFDIMANITCSKRRRHASRTSLIVDLEQAALPFSFEPSIMHRRGRYSDCINPRLLNRSHLSACIQLIAKQPNFAH